MSEGGESPHSDREQPAPDAFWQAFDRELAEINATLARLERSLRPAPASAPAPATAPRRRVKRVRGTPHPADGAVPADSGGGASPGPQTAPAEPTAPAPAPAAPEQAPQPSGTDLADPRNFGQMPPVANLEPGSVSIEEYRKRLGQDLAFANKVLHTSRVPAPVWREWRAFEKAAHERLRALASQPGPADEDIHI